MTFELDLGEIRKNLGLFDDRANRAIAGIFKYQESRSETFMKTNAPWTDRTGNARNGLFAKASRQRTRHQLLLSHIVAYGIYLETMQSGKYQIILPAVRAASDEIWRTIRKLLDLMEGG